MNTLQSSICALVLLSGFFNVDGMNNGGAALKKEDIKGFTKILDVIYNPTAKIVVCGGILITSPILWDIAAAMLTNTVSPFATVAYYATNSATATLVPIVLNQVITSVIKPLPNSLHNKNWPKETAFLKKLFLKEYTSIAHVQKKYCSRFMWNPEECVKDSRERYYLKQPIVHSIFLRGRYRVLHNKEAATIVGIQLLFTLYAMVCTLKAKSLDNRTKGLATLVSLYAIIGQLHECTNIKYFSEEDTNSDTY